MDPIGTIKDVYAGIGKLRELSDELKGIEAKAMLVELQGKLLDVQQQLIELREANQRLTTQLAEARGNSPFASRVRFADGYIWLNDPSPHESRGPYCHPCFVSGSRLAPLLAADEYSRTEYEFKCAACSKTFGKGDPTAIPKRILRVQMPRS